MNGKYNRDVLLKLEEYKVIYLYTSPKMPLWEKENSIEVIAISDEFDTRERAARFELELSTLIISDKATIRVEAIHPYFFNNNPEYFEQSLREKGLFLCYTNESGWLYNR